MTSECLELRRREQARRSPLQASIELNSALEALNDHDPQRVLSALVQMTPERIATTFDDPRRKGEQNIKTVDFASLELVELFQRIAREFQDQEEIQCTLCGVLETACSASRRFQREVGRLHLWRELGYMRQLHPLSRRILVGSLRVIAAIFQDSELNTIEFAKPSDALTISTSELLVEELLQMIARYGDTVDPCSEKSGPSRRDFDIVVVAMRVLAALLSCPTSPSGPILVLAKKYSRPIFASMKANLTLFQRVDYVGIDTGDPMLTWLTTCRALVHLHSPTDTLSLMFKAPDTDPWYQVVAVEHWDRAKTASRYPYPRRHRRALILYLAIMTHIFALPHTRDDSECLSMLEIVLSDHQAALGALSGLVSNFHSRVAADNSEEDLTILLQLLRLVHLWSERPHGAELLKTNSYAMETLVPVFVAIIDRTIQPPTRVHVPPSIQNEQINLAALLIVQRLATSPPGVPLKLRKLLEQSLRPGTSTLERTTSLARARSMPVQSSTPNALSPIKALHSYACSDGYDDDRSLDAVIKRELDNTVALFVQKESNSKARGGLTKSSSSLTLPVRRRGSSNRLHHSLKSSTVAIYTTHS